MTKIEHVKFCNKCVNHQIHPEHELICGLTKKAPDFEGECTDFELIKLLEGEVEENEGVSSEKRVVELNDDDLNKLRYHQNFNFALVGGLLSTIISAIIWAVISVSTQYQI
jgi:hypothetical protein